MTGQTLRLDSNVKSRLKLAEAHDCRDERGAQGEHYLQPVTMVS